MNKNDLINQVMGVEDALRLADELRTMDSTISDAVMELMRTCVDDDGGRPPSSLLLPTIRRILRELAEFRIAARLQ